MNRLLLEIYADRPTDAAAGGGAPPGLLISTRDPGDPSDPASAVTGSRANGGGGAAGVVVLHLLEGGCVLQDPAAGAGQPVGLGEWLQASGWKVRVTNAPGGATASQAMHVGGMGGGAGGEESNWAAPEIRISTYDGDQVKTVRALLPVDEGSQLIVGRGGPNTDLAIEDDHVSRVHARFFVANGQRMVEDMGSRWGTRLNGEPLSEARALKHGDELRLGKSTVQYVCYWDMMPASGAFSVADVAQAPPASNGGGLLAEGQANRTPRKSTAAGDAVSEPITDKTPVTPPEKPAEEAKAPEPAKAKQAEPKVEPIRPKAEKAAPPDAGTKPDVAAEDDDANNPFAPKPPAPVKETRKPAANTKRSRGGLEIVGAIFLVLVVLAGIGYLVYLVFFNGKK